MRQKLLVLVALLALAGGGSSARGADTKELEHVLERHGPFLALGQRRRQKNDAAENGDEAFHGTVPSIRHFKPTDSGRWVLRAYYCTLTFHDVHLFNRAPESDLIYRFALAGAKR